MTPHLKGIAITSLGVLFVVPDSLFVRLIDVAPDGRALLVQPDICDGYSIVYDVYRLETNQSLRQLTHCARLRRAVQAGDHIIAIQHGSGDETLSGRRE